MNPSASIPPPPPPLVAGSIPARKLQTQLPPEAPACVQNAMMTKDKKPFTYTPGGIDLSQIKSPRMAKRIYMNAHSEGVTNQPKISPLAQPNNSVGGGQNQNMQSPVPVAPPPPSMGAAAMGMPFQVFPGPPPPVMPMPPPPPPPQPKMQLNQSNGNNRDERKSPQPQSFEPPPMGCRPEIKIPPNPMASLKRAPRPQPKGDYWIDEYRQEKMGDEKQPSAPQYMCAQDERTPSPEENVYEQQQKSFNEPKPQTPVMMSPQPKNNVVQDLRSADSPKVQSPPILTQSPIPANLPPPITPIKTPVTSPIKEDVQQPFHTQILYQQPQQPQNMQQQQQQQQQQPKSNIIISTMPQMKNPQLPAQKELGALYIPPPMEDPLMKQQFYMTPQSPPWMSSKPKGDMPEWVNKDEVDFNQMQLQHQRFLQQQQQQFNQMMSPKERVIPISFEKSTTPVRTPAGFGPQPYYGNNQQFISPKPDPNANQFVNQGYNNISFSAPQSPRVMPQQPAGTRIIPIQIERSNGNQHRSPYPEQTVVMQGDPRSPQSPRINQATVPNQSRSFKVLQKITDTVHNDEDGDDDNDNANTLERSVEREEPMEYQKPHFSRPMQQSDLVENQMKRMQVSDNEKAYMDRMKNQSAINQNQRFVQQRSGHEQDDTPQQYIPPSEQQVREPNLYLGSAIPSRSFKILQAMTNTEDNDS